MDFSKFSRQQLIDFLRSKSVKTLMKTLSRTVTKFEAPFDGDYDLPKIDEVRIIKEGRDKPSKNK